MWLDRSICWFLEWGCCNNPLLPQDQLEWRNCCTLWKPPHLISDGWGPFHWSHLPSWCHSYSHRACAEGQVKIKNPLGHTKSNCCCLDPTYHKFFFSSYVPIENELLAICEFVTSLPVYYSYTSWKWCQLYMYTIRIIDARARQKSSYNIGSVGSSSQPTPWDLAPLPPLYLKPSFSVQFPANTLRSSTAYDRSFPSVNLDRPELMSGQHFLWAKQHFGNYNNYLALNFSINYYILESEMIELPNIWNQPLCPL